MRLPRVGAILAASLLLGLGPALAGATLAIQAAQPAGPTRCHLIGRATKPPERLSASQFLLTLTVDRQVKPAEARSGGEASIIVNSTYGASYYRPFDIKMGTALEVAGYVRTGGQCVVDTLNVGTLEPGYEGYLRPPEACPSPGDETISVYEKAAVSLGCAVAPMFTAPTALQRFQGGVMLHARGIYVVKYGPATITGVPLDGGTWSGTRDTYREPEPAQLGLAAPAGFFEPRLGFGKAWREEYGGPAGPLGWALEEESTADASWQLFERGIVVVTREGEGIILYHDGRVWEYRLR
ncbi:MAG: hypothetical protein M3O34_12620 [Chloroflexota bacterium]|nr:hypothetical protein [Chloroflexota bacterium]